MLFLTNYKYIIDSTNNNTVYAHSWQSNGISHERLNASGKSTSNDEAPIVKYENGFVSLKFSGDLLKQNKVTYAHGKIINICIV